MKVVEMKTDELGDTTIGNAGGYLSCAADKAFELKPNTSYAVIAIEIPSSQRLVTEDEKAKYAKPSEYYYVSGDLSFEQCRGNDYPTWNEYVVYAVPTDHVWAEDKVKTTEVTLTLTPQQLEDIKEILGDNV